MDNPQQPGSKDPIIFAGIAAGLSILAAAWLSMKEPPVKPAAAVTAISAPAPIIK